MDQVALDWSVDVAEIDRARILRGWTRRDLAREAHVDEGTLCDFFAGRRRPTFGTLKAIGKALELSMEDLIRFTARDRVETILVRVGEVQIPLDTKDSVAVSAEACTPAAQFDALL